MVTAYLAAGGSNVNDLLSNRLILVIVGAILGFISAYVMEVIKGRRAPRKVLSWDLVIDEPKLVHGAASADRLKMSYAGRAVDHLASIRYAVTNTGNSTIKNQYLRIAPPVGVSILEKGLDPTPKPEIGAEEVADKRMPKGNLRYRITHLEPTESVSFYFVAEGGDWRGWEDVVLHNDDGDVVYQRRGAAQQTDDKKHVAPFLTGMSTLIILAILSLVAYFPASLLAGDHVSIIDIFGWALMLVALLATVGVGLVSKAARAARVFADVIASLSEARTQISAGASSVVALASQGTVSINTKPGDE